MSKSTALIRESLDTSKLAAPIILSSLIQVSHGFIDTVMLGRYSAEHLAAGSLGSVLWLFVILAGIGLTMGLSPIIAQHAGANKKEKITQVFQQGVWLSLAVGIVSLLLLQNIHPLLRLLKLDVQLVSLTASYLTIVSWGTLFSQVYLAGRFVSEGTEYTRPMMIIQILTLPINILGNYLLIFGKYGFPELGVAGAAISTSIGLFLGFVLMVLNLIYNRHYKPYRLFENFSKPNLSQISTILKLSIPIAVSMMLEHSLFTAVSLLMAKLGIISLAAHQIALNYAAMMFMVPLGFSMAATVKVGNAIGRGEIQLAKLRGWVAIMLAVCFMLLSTTLILFFRHQIASVYTNNQEILNYAAQLLILAAIFQISDGTQVSTAGALRGFKDTTIPMVINFIGYWLIGFPVAYYLGFIANYKAQGLWWGLIIGLTSTAILLLIRYKTIISSQTKKQFISY